MLKLALQIFQGIRAAALLSWAFAAVFLFGFGLFGQDPAIAYERRLTTLETKGEQFGADLRELKTLMYWALIGTGGLAGEAGIRVVAAVAMKKKEAA